MSEEDLIESFGSFGAPGSYDYSEETDEDLLEGEAPPVPEYDYGELSLDNLDDMMDDYSYDDEITPDDDSLSEEDDYD